MDLLGNGRTITLSSCHLLRWVIFYFLSLFVHPTRPVYLRTNPAMVWGKGVKKFGWNGLPSHRKYRLRIWIREAVNRRSFCSVPFPAISLFIEGSWKRGGAFFPSLRLKCKPDVNPRAWHVSQCTNHRRKLKRKRRTDVEFSPITLQSHSITHCVHIS